MFKPILALALVAGTAPAFGQSLPAAEFGLTLGTNFARSENFKRAESGFTLPLRGDLGLQADLAVSKYQTARSIVPSGGLHLTYAATGSLTFGAFVFGETPADETRVSMGIEAVVETGPWHVEGYAGAIAAVNDTDRTGRRYGVDVAYAATPDWRVTGGLHRDDFDGSGRGFVQLGADYAVTQSLRAGASYGRTDRGNGVLTVQVDLTTGPVAFARRDGYAGLPGY